jgi:hypothetical protein
VEIVGRQVKELHRDFCRGKCTMIKADGVDIQSVTYVAPKSCGKQLQCLRG